jgi:tetratricopeptide (TPR) repeat protein
MSVPSTKIRFAMPAQAKERSPETIGVRLKRLRLERGLSQRDLSSPGVSYAYISRIEAGARTPSVKALRMLARKLGVSVEYLETGRDIREVDERELRLADAELELRLARDTETAERKLHEIYEEAARAGDVFSANRAQIALGLAAAQRGNHLDAVERLEGALAEQTVAAHTRPDLYATLGQSYGALGAPERAVRLFERCLEEVTEQAADDAGIYIRYATFLSYALSDTGDYDRAAEVVRTALMSAEKAADPYSRVRLYWSLARIAAMEGRSIEALENIRRAIALLETTEHTVQLARAHLLSAGIEAGAGRVDDTRAHLESAERLLGPVPESADLGLLRIGRSRLAALEGDGERAVLCARNALDTLGDFHGADQGSAVWALAEGLALQQDLDTANDAFRRAVDLLTVHGRRHDAAQACMRWGQMLQEAGRDDEASTVLQRAADLGPKAETGAGKR